MKVERITIATLTKLFATKRVANNNSGWEIFFKVFDDFDLPSNALKSDGVSEKYATSEPLNRADKNRSRISTSSPK